MVTYLYGTDEHYYKCKALIPNACDKYAASLFLHVLPKAMDDDPSYHLLQNGYVMKNSAVQTVSNGYIIQNPGHRKNLQCHAPRKNNQHCHW